MHYYGDSDFSDDDFQAVDDAAGFIHDYCVKYARLGGQYKEKYGRCCFYAQFGLSLHSLFYPGHYYYRLPKWTIKFDLYVFTPLCYKLKISWLWDKWQKFIYVRAYKLAVKKYPRYRKEIIGGADWSEWLKNV